MGMFDRVLRDSIKCPTCGAELDDFQTKSGICQNLSITEDQLIEDAKRFGVKEPYYYDYCPNCRTCVTFEYKPGHWEMEIETLEERQEKDKKADEFWKNYYAQQKNVL